MTELWDKIKKNVIDSLNLAIDKTEELTSVGRIKLEILHLEHRLDGKYVELGKVISEKLAEGEGTLCVDEKIREIHKQIESLKRELHEKESELGRIKSEEGIDFDS